MTRYRLRLLLVLTFLVIPNLSHAWYDVTHPAVAKAAGYCKWHNAASPDNAKIKAGDKENFNHYSHHI
jgi:hypothetical protein